jgi:hypothetical protein
MNLLRLSLVLGLALTTAACGLLPHRQFTPQAVPASCASDCFVPCTTTDIAWTADPNNPAAYDALGEEVFKPLAQRVADCNLNRVSCHVCLLRLQEKGIVIGIPPLPPAEKRK